MEGYKNCKSCGRRFLATDNSEYCSPSCFSLESTVEERKPSKFLFYLPFVCLLLFCFFLFEDLDVNFFFLQNVSFLRGYAENSFDEAGHNGVFYLHENMREADDDTLLLLLETLGKCTYLPQYCWRPKLVKEIDSLYHDDFPELQEAAIDVFAQAKMVPKHRLFIRELQDSRLRERVLSLMLQVPAPQFVKTISKVTKDPDVDEETVLRCIEILKNIKDKNLHNGLLCMRLIYANKSAKVQRVAVMAVPDILWPKKAMTFNQRANANFIKIFKGLQRVASSHDVESLRSVALKAVQKGRKEKRSFVKFAALDVFEEVFNSDENE